MKRCTNCGRIMSNEFNGEVVMATCWNDNCYSMIEKFPQLIDEVATEQFWKQLDKIRIKENPCMVG